MIEAKSSSLTARHNAHSGFASRYAFQSNFIIFLLVFFNILTSENMTKWLVLNLDRPLSSLFLMEIDIIEKLVCLIKVHILQLLQELFGKCLIFDRFVMLDKMLLSCFGCNFQNIFLHNVKYILLIIHFISIYKAE